MPNVVLERLHDQRAEQLSTMDALLAQVEERDLSDAERGLLEHARVRIGEIDAQIAPLEQLEQLRGVHAERVSSLPSPASAAARPIGGAVPECPYASAGEFLVDLIRSRGFMDRPGGAPDEQAMARVHAAYQTRAVANQTTADTPGILPTPIVGTVVSLIDANRPFVSSVGARPLGNIPGTTFTRPKITQHVSVGAQAAEKTELPSQKMIIGSVPFTKRTYGGVVDISRQDIDWSSPSAWDILVRDLADVYAVQMETVMATAFAGAANATKVPVATDDLHGWVTALYTAAMRSYKAGLRMPDRIWCSLDVWAALGALVDTARVVFPQNTTDEMNAPGTSSLADFRGDVLGLPRVVVPTFPNGTCIIGPSALYEVYEEVIGLLSVVEPSILGVTVAYGGYVANGTLNQSSFVALDTTALTLPAMLEEDAPSGTEAEAANHAATSRAK